MAGTYDYKKNSDKKVKKKNYKSILTKEMEIISALNETVLTQIEDENFETEIAEKEISGSKSNCQVGTENYETKLE